MKNNNNNKEQRVAVLIDSENVPHSNIAGILEEVTLYGTPTIKRIYGDWTKPNASGWKQHLLSNALTPIQQYSYTTGKNSSDSAMIIDAMDLLYEGNVERFCIISSDSDFTRLAIRLRESGRYVIGIGERKTPSAFIVACDKFIYMDLVEMKTSPKKQDFKVPKKKLTDLEHLVAASINDLADDNGYVFMGDLGNSLMKKRPDFDPRDYGYYQLTQLVKAMNIFEIDERRVENSNVKHVYIRNRS